MTTEFEKMVQNKINQTAALIIEADPELAKNNPQQVGEIAKKMVFDALNLAIDELS